MKFLILCLAVVAVSAGRDPRCPNYGEESEAAHFPHESDCTKFYKCDVNGEASVFQCQQGLEFDAELGVCFFVILTKM